MGRKPTSGRCSWCRSSGHSSKNCDTKPSEVEIPAVVGQGGMRAIDFIPCERCGLRGHAVCDLPKSAAGIHWRREAPDTSLVKP
jgi:hypothetical protein